MSTDTTPNPPTPSLWLTIPDVCRELKLSRPTVQRIIARGALVSVQIGRARRMPRAALERFANEMVDQAAHQAAGR